MTRLPDTHAPAPAPVLATVRGPLLLRAIAGVVVAALLLVVGLPREADMPTPSSRVASAFVHAAVSQAAVSKVAVSKSDAVRAPLHAVAPNVAEADDWAGRPALADPLSHRLPRLSDEAGFHPRETGLFRTWASAPPDRPPRRA
ncbi:hypothetical protein FV222_25065 [Methylobacterium sp. WL103]|uniref:hypothetical protein n=1 Tax=Methylobacterium TaxID=407 RepID=UPI0011C7846B|nr:MULTISPECIES: hypothetical protein [Methylobacterium]TXM72864.1 hypothetical protein FV226_10965 [Methylobacterium sp. WL12]TXM90789.1 hypothetical protein FV222_25065 [Methylobacterium sp. WL103]TXN81431.1 hypothetical protein FV234_13510 [Methylobacterium sp. WL8]